MAYSDETQLVTEVRRLINEPVALVHSDADIVAWLDRGAEEIARITMCLEKGVSGITDRTKQLNTGSYMFTYASLGVDGSASPAGRCIKIDSILYVKATSSEATSGYALMKTHPRQMAHNTTATSGCPTEWWDVDEKLFIWPPPDSNASSKYLRVLYYKHPTNGYSEGANLPNYLNEYVIYFAVAKAFMAEGKTAQHDQFMSIFYSMLDFHRQDKYKESPDSKDMIKIQDNTQILQ